jgi:hypothetical protein
MVKPRLVQCVHCHGRNWEKIVEVDAEAGLWLWQCGGVHAHADAEEGTKNGCMRIIVATEAEINAEGQI